MQTYTKHYYESVLSNSRSSAVEIVPLIFQLLQPKSVVDVGCGRGDWLSVFKKYGIHEILGLDGDWVETEDLEIPPDQFFAIDLETPIKLERQFDLVISLEVAEHLPSDAARTFVDSLTRLGPVVVFSAAIPFQGGTRHQNEQWPEYWAGHFRRNGYVAIDCLRRRIWENQNVEWWYAQNILIFAREDCLKSYPELAKAYDSAENQLSIVHPRLYLEKVRQSNPRAVLRTLLADIKNNLIDTSVVLLKRNHRKKHRQSR